MLKSKSVQVLVSGLLMAGLFGLTFGLLAPTPLAGGPATPTPKPEPVVASVYFSSPQALAPLQQNYDLWQVDHRRGLATLYLSPDQLAQLRAAGYRVVTDQDKTAELAAVRQSFAGKTQPLPGFSCYRTVEETYADLAQLAADHPTLAAWHDIGDSWEKENEGGGYDLYALTLTNQTIPGPKPKLFILSTVHARELATAELATRFAEYLVAGYDHDPDITWLLDQFEIDLIPQANPDGRKLAETGQLWRKNTDNDDGCSISSYWGVDLNRNSSFKWNGCGGGFCSSGNACDITYRGPAPASEPETRAFEAYVESRYPDQRGPNDDDPAPDEAMGIFITLHSYGQWILFPWGWGNVAAPNDRQLETLGRKFGYYTDYEVCQSGESGCIYPTDGSNDDWAYGQLGLAAYTFELGTTFFQGCDYFENQIISENFPALLYAFKATRRPYQTPAGPETLQMTATPTTVVAGRPISLTALADDSRYDSNGWGNEPVQAIAAARYSLDGPSWQPGIVSQPISAADGGFDSPAEALQVTINTSGWSPGRHLIMVESQDADGNWGVPSGLFVWVTAGLSVTPSSAEQWAKPGQKADYLLQVSHSLAAVESFTVTVNGNRWPTLAPTTIAPPGLNSGSLPFTVSVRPPLSASVGDFDVAQLIFTPQSATLTLPAVVLTTTIKGDLYIPLVFK